jgi:hypothetical protein
MYYDINRTLQQKITPIFAYAATYLDIYPFVLHLDRMHNTTTSTFTDSHAV